jgi:hypothetical protein
MTGTFVEEREVEKDKINRYVAVDCSRLTCHVAWLMANQIDSA